MHDISLSTDITLPPAFAPTTPASLRAYIRACVDFLVSPLVNSLLQCHPNDIAVDGPRSEWLWWGWASKANWKLLIPGWPCDGDEMHMAAEVPLELRQMLGVIDTLTLPRAPNSNVSTSVAQIRGMSPKKSHEVAEMSAFIGFLLSQSGSDVKHVVDVGAGQGYLSRALSENPHRMNVLALDMSEVQTRGAERRGMNIKKITKQKPKVKETVEDSTPGTSNATTAWPESGSVTHEMIHINARTLENSVTSWISADESSSRAGIPVLFVALHACGSLSPDILRCYVACRNQTLSSDTLGKKWTPAGLVAVGCCYNLMSHESDFPMSSAVSNEMEKSKSRLLLSYNHRSLAAQSPSQWSLNVSTRSAAGFSIRKVVYRALLEKQIALATCGSKDRTEPYRKVGRMHDSTYTSLPTFISSFNTRQGTVIPVPAWDDVQGLASSLEVLHVLRSRIGPVVESLILVDRLLYLAESLPQDDVLSVNLFDQKRGSARNVALVVQPRR